MLDRSDMFLNCDHMRHNLLNDRMVNKLFDVQLLNTKRMCCPRLKLEKRKPIDRKNFSIEEKSYLFSALFWVLR